MRPKPQALGEPPVCDVEAPVGTVPAVTRAAHHFKQAFKGRMTRVDIDRRCTTPGRLARETGGPFAKLRMPPLPREPGLYLWEEDGTIVYVGQTRMPLAVRLGPQGYATISNYNTFARQPGRTNGGQQTNCRVNALANRALTAGHSLVIWYRTTLAEHAGAEEAAWMQKFGVPPWNRRDERSLNADL